MFVQLVPAQRKSKYGVTLYSKCPPRTPKSAIMFVQPVSPQREPKSGIMFIQSVLAQQEPKSWVMFVQPVTAQQAPQSGVMLYSLCQLGRHPNLW